MMKPSETCMKEYQLAIEQYFQKYFAVTKDMPQAILYDAMSYSVMAGGKRLRPILAMEFCRLCCKDWKPAIPFAAAVEMIHTYSLIHDDLPCMDNDDYRRGMLTNHKVYGEAMAILAGDALLTDAFAVAASADLPRERIQMAIHTLAHCAGSDGMVGGQVLDILSDQRECTEEEILAVQNRKTSALIRAACCLGAIAGGANTAQLQAADRYADALGLAFQIRDDMLDVIGDQQELGKAVGVDEGKNTFVRLYGLQKCQQLISAYTEDAISALSAFEDPSFLTALALQLTDRTK